MNYEQKYNKLVNAIKVLQKTNPSDEGIQNWVNENVPELAESKDERIRKAIIELVRQSSEILEKKNQEQMIAWLEKQGEQKEPNGQMNILSIMMARQCYIFLKRA